MIKRPYEAIIIGSGATGGVAALTLAQAGVRALVIEAGPELTAKEAIGSEPSNSINRMIGIISGKHRLQIQHPGYWKANPNLYINEKDNPYSFPKEKPFIWTQGRQVGGRSLTWGGITLRLSSSDLKASEIDGYGPKWPIKYSQLKEHYSFLEKLLKVHGHKDQLDQLPDGYFIESLPFTPSEDYFAKVVSSKLGYPVIHSRGFGPYIDKSGNTWPSSSSPGSTLRMAIETGKIEMLSNHFVETLVIKGESATGLIAINVNDGSRIELNAKLIVLCASTIQTLKILLNTKSKYNNSIINESGLLGCNLMDHISSCRFFTLPSSIKSNKSSHSTDKILSGAGSFFIPFGSNLDKRKDIDFIRGYGIWGAIDRFNLPSILKKDPRSSMGFLIGHGEVLPYKSNKITLSDKKDKWGIPIPHIEMEWKENEFKMVNHMNKIIEMSISAAGGEVLPLNKIVRMPLVEPLLNDALALQESPPPPGYYVHEVGGAPMGKSPMSSVLDPLNRLWRIQNVLVVDGACWPTSSWQSPTLTMMAITRRACIESTKSLVS